MNQVRSLPIALLMTRVSIFVVFLLWGIDKLIRPEHAAAVFSNFYLFQNLTPVLSKILGIGQLILSFAFLLGFKKNLTYGLVFLLHLISTVSCYKQYLAPYQEIHLLFFAAWPMLAACFTLWVLRDYDVLAVVKGKH
jgi:putative oxidoreductase